MLMPPNLNGHLEHYHNICISTLQNKSRGQQTKNKNDNYRPNERFRTGKSHSWSSGLSEPTKPPKVRASLVASIRKWILGAVHWCRIQRMPLYLADFCKTENWNVQHIGLLLRLTAIGCLLLGAFLSLLATFLPSVPFR